MIFPDWLEHIDRALFLVIHNDWKNGLFDRVLPVIRNRDTWVPFYLLLALFLLYRFKWKGLLMIAIIGATAGASDQLSSSVVKPLVGRERPCHEPELEGQAIAMVYCGKSKSFTSSHAANHTAIAMIISLLFFRKRKVLTVVLFFWAFMIGYAQIYVGVHYPLDIIGGMILGAAVGWLIFTLASKLGYRT